jgi:hypothetical protein
MKFLIKIREIKGSSAAAAGADFERQLVWISVGRTHAVARRMKMHGNF